MKSSTIEKNFTSNQTKNVHLSHITFDMTSYYEEHFEVP